MAGRGYRVLRLPQDPESKLSSEPGRIKKGVHTGVPLTASAAGFVGSNSGAPGGAPPLTLLAVGNDSQPSLNSRGSDSDPLRHLRERQRLFVSQSQGWAYSGRSLRWNPTGQQCHHQSE